MGMVGPWQILIIVFVIILLFGAKKLPQLARSLGESIGEFKKGRHDSDLETQERPGESVDTTASSKKTEDKTAS